MKEIKRISDLIGNTPLIKIRGNVFAKLEAANPSGSIKDRLALYMLETAEKNNEIKPGYEIMEATSGNTGISFAMIAALKGYVRTRALLSIQKLVLSSYCPGMRACFWLSLLALQLFQEPSLLKLLRVSCRLSDSLR